MSIRRITLVNLETLCAIARLGTFRAAADKLNTTQPAVSARVREVEDMVGRPLFQRRGRRMELSLEGRQLVQQAEPLLARFDELLVSLKDPSAATGLIRIGLGEIIAHTWFPRFVCEARRLMPNLIFDVKVDLTIRSRQDLENGKLDIAFIGGSVASGMLDSAPLGKLPMRWVGSPALLGKDAAKRTLAELLSRYPVWSLSKTSLLFPILASELDEKNLRVNVNMCDNITAMVGLLAAGAGIGILPEMLVSEELNRGQLVRIGKGRADTSLPFVAAWHSDEKQVAVLTLIELAKNVSTFI